MDVAQTQQGQARSTSGSVRPHGSRNVNPDKQISQIEKSVTHLLVATKQLLETLTQWSRGNAQEEEVSDVYVRLGYEFNLACRAFNSIGVETSDLGPVPDLLRSILEDTLSQPASPQSLDNYLPRIRDIIINLLHGLKRKQSKLRNRPSKDGPSKPSVPNPTRQGSVTSTAGSEASYGTQAENVLTPSASVRSESRQESIRSVDELGRASSASSNPTLTRSSSSLHRSNARPQSRSIASTEIVPSTDPPLIVAPPEEFDRVSPSLEASFGHGPVPPPKSDALTALQRGGDLERRASRRFSAYQISKHLGGSPNGIANIPPAQNSPIPNRGREAQESMSAVRSRTSYANARQRPPTRLTEITNSATATDRPIPSRISEEQDIEAESLPIPQTIGQALQPEDENDSPTVQTPEEFKRASSLASPNGPILGPTVKGPLSPPPAEFMGHSIESLDSIATSEPIKVQAPTRKSVERIDTAVATPQQPIRYQPTQVSPPDGKELTLFLQYKSKIKKFVLAEGYDELTIARLQLAFIEKFNWHTHNNGVDLPEIYIQDPVSGVRHELEELTDVKDRSVLVLNIEVLDEVKKHFDEGIGGLQTTLDGFRSLLDGQGSLMQRFSDRQLEASKEMARLSALPPPRPTRGLNTAPTSGNTKFSPSEASASEVQNLRRDIAVLRQSYSTMASDFADAMKDVRAKAEVVKSMANQAVAPSYAGDAGRAHVNQGKKTLSSDSEALVNRVDDLSDAIEDLRKDVVTRGVRPLPRQLEDISREITATAKDLLKMKEFMKREKPIWTKIWEQELNLVCTERDDLTQQEDLMADLDGDLDDVTNVFKLVEEAMKQQSLQGAGPVGFRNASRTLEIDPSVDPQLAKDGMLGEVRALQPNHETRLEAIERAEKARQKELENRKGDEFQREVANFVEEGKLKKIGGMEEVERLRKIKDERARKENFERQAQMNLERERKRAEAAAAKRAAAAAAAANPAPRPLENGDIETPQPSETLSAVVRQAVETPLPMSDSVNDLSQGESSFQDARESIASSSPTPTQMADDIEKPEALHPVHSPKLSENHANSTGTVVEKDANHVDSDPASDTADKGKATESRASLTSTPDRSSWWKPAIFSP